MPGSITLPQVVLDLEEEDRKRYEALQPPKSMVVRYGAMRWVAELPYDGKDKAGCGSKLVLRTDRGTELGEMLTTTCSNGGCGKSVSRQQMLSYIEASGGRNFPFTTSGRVLRVATPEDLLEQQRLDTRKPEILRFSKAQVALLRLPMKLADAELLLGGERIILHYTSEQWVDFRELVKLLAAELQTRIEMHQVNARDEARVVADYERCGQHCCCKQFLKVLKPVSMRMAKVQKATLDPTKISGRCGRLMCCLRYEDETYESLRKKLPHKQTRMLTQDGPGTVIDGQILTQLVLIKLDKQEAPQAYPLETLQPLPKDQDPYGGRPPVFNRGGDDRDRHGPSTGRPPRSGPGGPGGTGGTQQGARSPSRPGAGPGGQRAAQPGAAAIPGEAGGKGMSHSAPPADETEAHADTADMSDDPAGPTAEMEAAPSPTPSDTAGDFNPPPTHAPSARTPGDVDEPLAQGDDDQDDADEEASEPALGGQGPGDGHTPGPGSPGPAPGSGGEGGGEGGGKRRRRRRRRRRRGGGDGGGPGGGQGGPEGGHPPGGGGPNHTPPQA